MKYTAVIEKTGNGYSAYLLDLPGCIAAGDTLAETAELIRQAATYHVEMIAEDGEAIPEPTSTIVEVEVPIPAAAEELAVEAGR
jgi:predicted RNase H-like HicB family nuclease